MSAPGNLDGSIPSRVILRPLGSPLTIGMSGLAIASIAQAGLDLHWISTAQRHQLGLVLVSVPFVMQLVACVFSYLARDGATGAAVGVLSTSWLALGLVHLVSRPGVKSGAIGLMLLASGTMLLLISTAIAAARPLPAAVFALAALRFITGGVFELGAGSFWQHAAGMIGLVVAGSAGYCVLAFELEGQHHRPVLPTFRRGRADAAISGRASAQLEGVINEPGVRQTT